MDAAARWKRAREIFDAVVDLAPSERAARLTAACEGDETLLREIESLLSHDQPSEDPVKRVVTAAARAGLGDELDLTPGQTLLHYGLNDKIGEGGMGVVWRATDFTLGREVAIKVLPSDFARDASRLARFDREAKLLAALNHPNIAAVYSLHDDGGRRFLAMEYVEGDDLSVRLARGRARRSGAPHCAANRRCAGGSAREGHRAPGSEACQREGEARWHGQGARFRTRQGRRPCGRSRDVAGLVGVARRSRARARA